MLPDERLRETSPAANGLLAAAVLFLSFGSTAALEQVLVERGSPTKYLANASDPGVGLSWTGAFDDSSWTAGTYGVGYENGSGAENLIQTSVPGGTLSVFTRAVFNIPDLSVVENLEFGADYDDGCVVWINGVEVFSSPEMPA